MSSWEVKLLSLGQNINQEAKTSNCTGTKNDSQASYHGYMLDCYIVDMQFQKLFSSFTQATAHTLKFEKKTIQSKTNDHRKPSSVH